MMVKKEDNLKGILMSNVLMSTGMIQLQELEEKYKELNATPGYGEWGGKDKCLCPMTLLYLYEYGDIPDTYTKIEDWMMQTYGPYGRGFMAGWDKDAASILGGFKRNIPFMKGYNDGYDFHKALKPRNLE